MSVSLDHKDLDLYLIQGIYGSSTAVAVNLPAIITARLTLIHNILNSRRSGAVEGKRGEMKWCAIRGIPGTKGHGTLRRRCRFILAYFVICALYKKSLSCTAKLHAERHIFWVNSKLDNSTGVSLFGCFIKFHMERTTRKDASWVSYSNNINCTSSRSLFEAIEREGQKRRVVRYSRQRRLKLSCDDSYLWQYGRSPLKHDLRTAQRN